MIAGSRPPAACTSPPRRRQHQPRAAAAVATAAAGTATLPDGRVVQHVSTAAEVAFLAAECLDPRRCVYTRGGVTLRPGDTVVDVGSNIGLFALRCCDAGAARVVCVEPSPDAAAALRANLAAHAGGGASCSWQVVEAAAGERSAAAAQLTVFPGAAGWSTLARDDDEVERSWLAYVRGTLLDGSGGSGGGGEDNDDDDDGGGSSSGASSSGRGEAWSPTQRALLAVGRWLWRAPPPLRGAAEALARLYFRGAMLRGARQVDVRVVTVGELFLAAAAGGGEEGGGAEPLLLASSPPLTRIDLLKVDVERGELAVLRGVPAERWPSIRQVAVEVHGAAARDAAAALLRGVGGFARVTVEQDARLGGTGLFNVYAVR